MKYTVLLRNFSWQIEMDDDDPDYVTIIYPKDYPLPHPLATTITVRNTPIRKPAGSSANFRELMEWRVSERDRKLSYAKSYIVRTLMREWNEAVLQERHGVERKCHRLPRQLRR
jgi:hypothetical protein